MLKDTRFILVWAEHPYVQFAAIAPVISTKRFIVGVTNGREKDRSQVSDGKVERALRAWLLLSCVLCDAWYVELIPSLVGCHALPFIDQGGAGITNKRKRKKQRQSRSFEGVRSSFSFEPVPLTRQTVSGIARLLILIGLYSGFVQQVVTSRLAPAGYVMHHSDEP